LLLLDEPSMGLAPAVADLIFEALIADDRIRRAYLGM
jgi:ABC-type branched-subunit amino acid transport system ATPase component